MRLALVVNYLPLVCKGELNGTTLSLSRLVTLSLARSANGP